MRSVIFATTLCVALLGCDRRNGGSAPAKKSPPPSPVPASRPVAKTLPLIGFSEIPGMIPVELRAATAENANPLAVQKLDEWTHENLRGRQIIVFGTVDRVSSAGVRGDFMVWIQPREGKGRVEAYFGPEQFDRGSRLKKGDAVTVLGVIAGAGVSDPVGTFVGADHCQFQ